MKVLLDERISQLGVLLIIPFLLLYLVLGVAGVQLLRANKMGLTLSYILQSLQAVSFSLGGLKYIFNAGASIWIGFMNSDIHLRFLPIDIQFKFGMNIVDEFLLVNIIPMILIVVLYAKADDVSPA